MQMVQGNIILIFQLVVVKFRQEETIKQGLHYFQMNGKEVFNTATKVLPEVIHEVLADNNLTANDIDWVIPHQPSVRILQKVAEEVNIPFEKSNDQYG